MKKSGERHLVAVLAMENDTCERLALYIREGTCRPLWRGELSRILGALGTSSWRDECTTGILPPVSYAIHSHTNPYVNCNQTNQS